MKNQIIETIPKGVNYIVEMHEEYPVLGYTEIRVRDIFVNATCEADAINEAERERPDLIPTGITHQIQPNPAGA